jgi:hypothetical protein
MATPFCLLDVISSIARNLVRAINLAYKISRYARNDIAFITRCPKFITSDY